MSFELSAAGRGHVERIEALMARVYRRADTAVLMEKPASPLEALLGREEVQPEDHYCAGVEMLGRFMEWVFESGPAPGVAVQRFYSVVNALRADLLLNMSNEEVAAIFGQGRAAESARTVLLNKKLKQAGFRHTTFRRQKTEQARQRMAKAQLGNRNRSGGMAKAVAKP